MSGKLGDCGLYLSLVLRSSKSGIFGISLIFSAQLKNKFKVPVPGKLKENELV